MNLNRPVILSPDIENRFQAFIVFEPASLRIPDVDVLLVGPKVRELYDQLMDKLFYDNTLKAQIIQNRIGKIGQMMDLLKSMDQVVLSKFFDRIWRRYSYISNIGEPFLDLSVFVQYFPEFSEDKQGLLAQRIDDDEDDTGADGDEE